MRVADRKRRATHRGAGGNLLTFASHFLDSRLVGFEKDTTICLTPIPSPTRPGLTHAYFPALGACCGLLEYVSALYRGNISGMGWTHVADWAQRYLPQPDYSRDTVRVFFKAFRHSVAHRGISTGVWLDRSTTPHRRVTWKVLADSRRPACILVAEQGILKNDPPWPCPFTHRMYIHLKALKTDLVRGVRAYAASLRDEQNLLLPKFERCMRQLYPPS
jgi:hypothetical protein